MNRRVLGEWLAIALGRRERLLALVPERGPWQRLALWGDRRLSVAAIVSGTDGVATKQLKVPFADASAALHIDGFVLGIDNDVEHTREADKIRNAIGNAAAGQAEGLRLIDNVMAEAVRPDERFDAQQLVRSGVEQWAAALLGVPNDDAPGVLLAGESVVERTYVCNGYEREMDEAALARARTCEAVVAQFRRGLGTTDPETDGTIRGELTRLDPTNVARDLIGLLGGPTALTVKSALSIIRWALAMPERWSEVNKAAQRIDFAAGVRRFVEEAPPEYFLPRWNGEGDRVLISNWHKGDRINTPFGSEPHKCLGESVALDALARILRPIFIYPRGAFAAETADEAENGLWIKVGF